MSTQPRRKRTAPEGSRRWSAQVTEHSDAMDLQQDIFKQTSARRIARSLKQSAQKSTRRKSEPFRSAMSMLTFYINRAGRNLSKKQLAILDRAKTELRLAFHRPKAKGPKR